MSTKSATFSTNYLIRQSPAAIAFIDMNQKFITVSDSWANFFGLDHAAVLGKTPLKVFGSADSQWAELLVKCIEKPAEYGFQQELDKSGKKYVAFTIKPWYDENENVIGTIVYAKDVTKKTVLEQRNDVLYSMLLSASEVSKVGIWTFDLLQNKLYWSKMAKAIHEVPDDYRPNIETATNFYKQGYSRNTISMLIHKTIEQGESYNERLQITTFKNNERWVTTAGKPIYKNGQIAKLVGTIQDITEQVQAETQIKESEKLFHTLIDNLPINIFIKNKDFKKILVNKAECQYVGADDPQQVIGKTDFDLYTKNMAQRAQVDDIHVMKTLKPILGKETVNIKKDGSKTYFLTSKIPLLDDDGNANALMGISIDITDLKQKQQELKGLIHVTALQNKKLLNFAHIVSHNLRSHSANFSMLLNFLHNEKDASQQQRILNMLTDASENLMVTLDDLNKVVDINTNINLKKEPLDFNHHLQSVKQKLSVLLRQNRTEIKNYIPIGTTIWAVPDYLENILSNLFTNALKYRHPNRNVEISLSLEKTDGIKILSFKDNGLGINLEKHGHKLFGMYKKFHSNKESRGIGLYLVKNQMEAMGGDILAESKVGDGTTFNLYFDEKKN